MGLDEMGWLSLFSGLLRVPLLLKKMGEKLYEILGMESCQMSLYVKIPQPDEKMPHCHQQPAVKIEIPNDTGGVVFP